MFINKIINDLIENLFKNTDLYHDLSMFINSDRNWIKAVKLLSQIE